MGTFEIGGGMEHGRNEPPRPPEIGGGGGGRATPPTRPRAVNRPAPRMVETPPVTGQRFGRLAKAAALGSAVGSAVMPQRPNYGEAGNPQFRNEMSYVPPNLRDADSGPSHVDLTYRGPGDHYATTHWLPSHDWADPVRQWDKPLHDWGWRVPFVEPPVGPIHGPTPPRSRVPSIREPYTGEIEGGDMDESIGEAPYVDPSVWRDNYHSPGLQLPVNKKKRPGLPEQPGRGQQPQTVISIRPGRGQDVHVRVRVREQLDQDSVAFRRMETKGGVVLFQMINSFLRSAHSMDEAVDAASAVAWNVYVLDGRGRPVQLMRVNGQNTGEALLAASFGQAKLDIAGAAVDYAANQWSDAAYAWQQHVQDDLAKQMGWKGPIGITTAYQHERRLAGDFGNDVSSQWVRSQSNWFRSQDVWRADRVRSLWGRQPVSGHVRWSEVRTPNFV